MAARPMVRRVFDLSTGAMTGAVLENHSISYGMNIGERPDLSDLRCVGDYPPTRYSKDAERSGSEAVDFFRGPSRV